MNSRILIFRFNDKLTINVQRSTSHTVSLSAEGNGTTIVSHPSLHPSVELGTDFSCHQNSKQFVLTNRGRRTQVHVYDNNYRGYYSLYTCVGFVMDN